MSAPIFHMFDSAARPVAPYSHAVEADGWIVLTGQIPNDPKDDGAPFPEGIAAQTRRVMANLDIVLGDLGLGFEHVVSGRVFLTHFERDYAVMNEVYAEFFPAGRRPARTCIGVTALAREALVEIDFVARRP